MEDLYPRDFIVALPKPAGYVGAEVLFGRDELPGDEEPVDGLDVIRLVPEHEAEQLTPPHGEVAAWKACVPPSLRDAIRTFILATGAYRERMGVLGPTTMLIHVHHRCVVQNLLTRAVEGCLGELRQQWRYGGESARQEWERCWDAEFRPVTVSLDAAKERSLADVSPFVDNLLRYPLLLRTLNSDSEDSLEYGNPDLNVIVVGGNRLSRGLTLEGLLVSYYVRRAMCLDTLMQMERWFGFRAEYVDLTRIWTTAELSQSFRDISLAEEELIREMRRYEREGITPLQLGPKVRAHPIMMVTSRAKMRNAREVEQNYAGRLISITSYALDDRDASRNWKLRAASLVAWANPHPELVGAVSRSGTQSPGRTCAGSSQSIEQKRAGPTMLKRYASTSRR